MALPTGLGAASGWMREERLWTAELTTGEIGPLWTFNFGIKPTREASSASMNS
jgi:hypothetical protein